MRAVSLANHYIGQRETSVSVGRSVSTAWRLGIRAWRCARMSVVMSPSSASAVVAAPVNVGTTAVRISWFYRGVLGIVTPVIRWWGRLEVVGGDLLTAAGPSLVIGNHDSYWDPLVVGVAALPTVQIRAVAKSTLWRSPGMARVLDGMGQLPITRGRADRAELARIVRVLESGGCVGIFPEGGISQGLRRRAYSGAGWLARTVPETRLVAVAITGAVDMARFPRRPRIKVAFFTPAGGPPAAGESSIGVSRRVTAEIRDRAPAVAFGRSRRRPPKPDRHRWRRRAR